MPNSTIPQFLNCDLYDLYDVHDRIWVETKLVNSGIAHHWKLELRDEGKKKYLVFSS